MSPEHRVLDPPGTGVNVIMSCLVWALELT